VGLRTKTTIEVPEDLEAASRIQTSCSQHVRLGAQFRYVAGAYLAYSKGEDQAFVVVSVLSTSNWRVVHEQKAAMPVLRPRIADMDSFREGPLFVEVIERLALEPDLILVHGHGIAHPRRFGVACHVGLSFDLPTIGVGIYWPTGCGLDHARFQGNGLKRGNTSAIRHDPSGDKVGAEVCTQDNEPPLRISPGHRVSVDDATSFVLRCSPWRQLPEPLFAAQTQAVAMQRSVEEK
jgi:deoxyribonuclease V